MPPTLRRVLLLVPPLAFAAFEGIHPRPDVNAQAVMDIATWFAAFHAIQLVPDWSGGDLGAAAR